MTPPRLLNRRSVPQMPAGPLGGLCTLGAAFVASCGLLAALNLAMPGSPGPPPDLWDCSTDAECEAAFAAATVDACVIFTCEGGRLP